MIKYLRICNFLVGRSWVLNDVLGSEEHQIVGFLMGVIAFSLGTKSVMLMSNLSPINLES